MVISEIDKTLAKDLVTHYHNPKMIGKKPADLFVTDYNGTLSNDRPASAVFEMHQRINFMVLRDAFRLYGDLQQKLHNKEKIVYGIITGNSFEYIRGRVMDDLFFRSLAVGSEDGLILRDVMLGGEIYRAEVLPEYYEMTKMVKDMLLKSSIRRMIYFQGNEVRLTLKPAVFFEYKEVLDKAESVLRHRKIPFFGDAEEQEGGYAVRHHDAIDIHPNTVLIRGKIKRVDKAYALKYIVKLDKAQHPIFVGDSLNDVPALLEIKNLNGRGFIVNNYDRRLNKQRKVFEHVEITNHPFVKGVIEVIVNTGILPMMRELYPKFTEKLVEESGAGLS